MSAETARAIFRCSQDLMQSALLTALLLVAALVLVTTCEAGFEAGEDGLVPEPAAQAENKKVITMKNFFTPER
jgi:hypothetical protein